MLDALIDTKRKCAGTTESGKACNAYALTDSEFCLFHEPSLKEFRRQNHVYGGRQRKYVNIEGVKMEIKNIDSVIGLIEEVISNLKVMDMSVSQARALLSAAETAMKALEYRDLTERVEALEEEFKKEGLGRKE